MMAPRLTPGRPDAGDAAFRDAPTHSAAFWEGPKGLALSRQSPEKDKRRAAEGLAIRSAPLPQPVARNEEQMDVEDRMASQKLGEEVDAQVSRRLASVREAEFLEELLELGEELDFCGACDVGHLMTRDFLAALTHVSRALLEGSGSDAIVLSVKEAVASVSHHDSRFEGLLTSFRAASEGIQIVRFNIDGPTPQRNGTFQLQPPEGGSPASSWSRVIAGSPGSPQSRASPRTRGSPEARFADLVCPVLRLPGPVASQARQALRQEDGFHVQGRALHHYDSNAAGSPLAIPKSPRFGGGLGKLALLLERRVAQGGGRDAGPFFRRLEAATRPDPRPRPSGEG